MRVSHHLLSATKPAQSLHTFVLEPGRYKFTPSASEDGTLAAWNAWSGEVECCDTGGGSCTKGWMTKYSLWSPIWQNAMDLHPGRYASPDAALAAATPTEVDLCITTFIVAYIVDSFQDNRGGVRLKFEGPLRDSCF